MLISDRGSWGERDPWQTEGGLQTDHVLRALRIPTQRIDDVAAVPHRIAQAQTLANASLRPVAVLLGRDLMWEES
jgi:sulfopyruvate decarboxylase subunit alpha